jgi:hypothetical protein
MNSPTESEELHEAFWRRLFRRRAELASLPFARLRPPVPSYVRETVELTLDRSVCDALYGLSKRLDITPLAVLLAGLKTVLFRYAGEETLIVGATSHAANERGDSSCPLLPIRTRWDAQSNVSAEALAIDVSRRAAEARAHAAYPLRTLQTWAGSTGPRFWIAFVQCVAVLRDHGIGKGQRLANVGPSIGRVSYGM